MRAVVSIILVIVSFFIFFSPVSDVLSSTKPMEQEKRELNAALSNANEIRATREALEEKYKKFSKSDLDRLNRFLPRRIDNVQLIIDLDNIASRYAMKVKNVTIKTDDTSGAPLGPSTSGFSSLVLGFSVTGNYEQLRAFLFDLERSLRLVDILGISFTSDVSGAYTYAITIKTYWLPDNAQK